MKVYRLETSEGTGVYGTAAAEDILIGGYHQPGPYDDGEVGGFGVAHFFGFTSIVQLMAWFDDELWPLRFEPEGIQLSVYEVDRELALTSNYQCAFVKHRAVLVDVITMQDLHTLYEEAA